MEKKMGKKDKWKGVKLQGALDSWKKITWLIDSSARSGQHWNELFSPTRVWEYTDATKE